MTGVPYRFDWDPAKAESNQRKHGVGFEEAMGVLADPLALSLLDDTSGAGEERWVTLGRSAVGRLLIVVHTYDDRSEDFVAIRVISARRSTRREASQYEDG